MLPHLTDHNVEQNESPEKSKQELDQEIKCDSAEKCD